MKSTTGILNSNLTRSQKSLAEGIREWIQYGLTAKKAIKRMREDLGAMMLEEEDLKQAALLHNLLDAYSKS